MDARKTILLAFALSGMAALIYEVTWTRPLQFTLGSTVYTVSIIFASFMAGLSLGSWIISRYIDNTKNLFVVYALIELCIGFYGIASLMIFSLLPNAYGLTYPFRENFYLFNFVQFLLSFSVLLIPTMLMGATFPVIAKIYIHKKIGKGIGEVYSVNNIGAIAGSFAAGFILIPLLGIKSAITIAALANIIAAFLILYLFSRKIAMQVLPAAFIIFLVLISATSYDIEKLHTQGFYRINPVNNEVLFYKEGFYSTVSVAKDNSTIALLINGKGQGSTVATDARVNFLLGYLPILLKPESKTSLVIGLGTGTTSGILSKHTKTTTVEIEPAVVEASRYFWFMNFDVLNNTNHMLVIDDARNYLMHTTERFDIISTEPCDPWQSFSSSLYSKEFFEIVKKKLNDGGLFVQWVPIYTMSVDDFKSLYHTFTSVFPYAVAFVNVKNNEGLSTTEIILIGSDREIDVENIRRSFTSLPETERIYLRGIRIDSADDILDLLLFTSDEMKGYADTNPIITDDNCMLEFSTSRKVLYQNPMETIADINRFIKGG